MLTALASFDMYANMIGGTLPTVLSLLTSLQLIDVEETMFTGSAFLDISALSELASYRVSLNSLTGTIPETFAPDNGSVLTEVWLAKNSLEGPIPESFLASNTQLTSLIMYSNMFTGTIPTSIGLLSNLEKLQLHGNAFTSTIPDALYGATQLNELRLDKNLITGTISTRIGDLVNLVDLRMGENPLTGTLPAEIARLSNLGK